MTLGLNPRGTDIRREGVGGHTDLPAEVALQHGSRGNAHRGVTGGNENDVSSGRTRLIEYFNAYVVPVNEGC